MKQPNILITNDDGIHAPGIKNLWRALSPYACTTIVAPITEQSGVALSTTTRSPLNLHQTTWEENFDRAWSVTGTPADSVKIALSAVLKETPDMVISGINRGANIGRTVLYSGTVAATIEAVVRGIPAIAFSCHDFYVEPNYGAVREYIPHIVQYVLENPLPKGSLLNVNFPEKRLGTIKGVKMTQQGRSWWGDKPDKRKHPGEGYDYFWLGAELVDGESSDETEETYWLHQGYVTVVPLHIGNLTDLEHLKRTQSHFEMRINGSIPQPLIHS